MRERIEALIDLWQAELVSLNDTADIFKELDEHEKELRCRERAHVLMNHISALKESLTAEMEATATLDPPFIRKFLDRRVMIYLRDGNILKFKDNDIQDIYTLLKKDPHVKEEEDADNS